MNWFKRPPVRDLAAEFDTYRTDIDTFTADLAFQVADLMAEVRRLTDLADPIALDAMQRDVYAELRRVQGWVDQVARRIEERSTNEDIATQRRLIDGLIGEVDILKSQQQQTGALLERAVIRP